MNSVCLIVNFQGFQGENGDFYARELGYAALTSSDCGYVMMDIGPERERSILRSTACRKSLAFVQRHVHGLPLRPRKGERALPTGYLYQKLASLHAQYSSKGKVVVAYKGGVNEKSALDLLGIPSVNLELFGCPVMKQLQQDFGRESANCGHHVEDFRPSMDHVPCAMGKVNILRKWMTEQMQVAADTEVAQRCLGLLKQREASKAALEREIAELKARLSRLSYRV